MDFGDTVKSPIGRLSRKNSRGRSKDTLNSRGSRQSGHESRVERFVNLRNPSIKQTLALFKERVNEGDVELLENQVRRKRADNKELMRRIREAEAMLKSLEIRQEREKSSNKKRSKLYKRKAISAIRKIGSAPTKKGSTSLFIRSLKKQMLKREKEQRKRKDNRRQKELKKKQRKAIEDIIKEGIENEKLRRRLNEALKRFAKKLDRGKIDSALMDEELERILDLRRVAQAMGVVLFGEDLSDEEVRELYKKKDFRVFQPNEKTVNQSAFVEQDSLDTADEVHFQKTQNRSVNVGRGNASMNLGAETLGKPRRGRSKQILGGLANSKFWKSGGRKKAKKTAKKTRKKSSNIKYKTKSGKVYNGRGARQRPKRTKSAIKRSKSPLSKSQYKLINEKKKRLKKSLMQSKLVPKNAKKRETKKRKVSRGNIKKSRSHKTQKSYTDKYEQHRGKRDFSGGNSPPVALGFESFKGKASIEKSTGDYSRQKAKSRSRPKAKTETQRRGVKLYMDKLKKKRDFADEKVDGESKLWGTRAKSKSKSKGVSRKKRKKRIQPKKTTLESQIVTESQVNEIIADESLGHASGDLKNSKMSLLSGQVSRKKIEKRPKKNKSRSRPKVYKSQVQKSKRMTKNSASKKQLSSKKTRSQKKGSRKRKIKKSGTKKSSEKLTNSDFRDSKLGRNDSAGSGAAMVNIRNGELVGAQSKRITRKKSAELKRRQHEGSRSRKTQRSADVQRKAENTVRRSALGQNEPVYKVREETRKLVVQMSVDGEVILREDEQGQVAETEMQDKLAELDEFMRSSSKKKDMQRQLAEAREVRDWDEELVNVERQFEQNLKDSSEKMIDTKMIDEELRRLEEMEKSFQMGSRGRAEQLRTNESQGSESPSTDPNFVKIVSFGPNGNSFMFTQNGETESAGLSLTEEQIQQKLRPFDRKSIFCGPEMQFSYQAKCKIDEELVQIGRTGLTITKLQRNKIMGEIMQRVAQSEAGTSSNVFSQSGSGREQHMHVPTAEFKPSSRGNMRGRVLNDFEIDTFEKEDTFFPNDPSPMDVDMSRHTIMGRRRELESITDGVRRRSQRVKRFRNNPSKDRLQELVGEERMREVIIQKLNESGVRDPSMGKPELQKTMRTLESEFNSIPENLREFN